MNNSTLRGRGLPRAWEQEGTFEDALYEWMQRAPWLAISATAHAMALLLLAIIPWHLLERREQHIIVARVEQAPEQEFEDLVEPEPVEVELPTVSDDAELVESPTDDAVDTDLNATDDTPRGDLDFNAEEPFRDMAFNGVLGIGGGAGGRFGDRLPGTGGGRRGGLNVDPVIAAGLSWLVEHQDTDGKWDTDGFMKHDPAGDACEGTGEAEHDVGVTGLALLALLGNGNSTRGGLYRENVSRAVHWLREQQDPDSGLIGERIGHAYLYDHAIATLALCEAYRASGSPLTRGTAQRAIGLVTRARNPYGVWRYSVPPNGDNDTSVTGWMVFALKSAEEAGLVVDSQAFGDALSWIDEVTDPATGRVGYDSPGSASSRVRGVNDDYPTQGGEAMTAVGLLSRFFLGQTPEEQPMMERHADLLARALPEWSEDGLTTDMYYWYYGTYAMYQMGGRHWRAWQKALGRATLETARQSGPAKGSWDPLGPWGYAGGRVYATATMVLCLEVYYRHARILGAR